MIPGDGDPRHGTQNGYGNLRCRCDECREAARLYRIARDFNGYVRERHHRLGLHVPREEYLAARRPEHGTESRYKTCRCDLCRTAAADARRARRRRAPGAQRSRP